jgi:hypothetical protein
MMNFDPIYNVDTAFDCCSDVLEEVFDILVYTRLALALKLDLTEELFPTIFPPFDPFRTIGKY